MFTRLYTVQTVCIYWSILVQFWKKQFGLFKIMLTSFPGTVEPVLNNNGKVSYSRKQREPLMGFQTQIWQTYNNLNSFHCIIIKFCENVCWQNISVKFDNQPDPMKHFGVMALELAKFAKINRSVSRIFLIVVNSLTG